MLNTRFANIIYMYNNDNNNNPYIRTNKPIYKSVIVTLSQVILGTSQNFAIILYKKKKKKKKEIKCVRTC